MLITWARRVARTALLICLLPILSLVAGISIAGIGKCQLDEGSVHPYLIAGVDFGPAA